MAISCFFHLKKRAKKHTTFLESIGIGLFKDERTQFTIGFFLFVVALVLIIAFTSYFFTADADQSLLLSMKEGDVSNTNNSFQNLCGSLGAIVSNYLIADCFGIADKRSLYFAFCRKCPGRSLHCRLSSMEGL